MSTQYRVPVLEQYAYQQAVINSTTSTPPGSPVKGDRYIVKATGTGAWTGKDNNIAWYDGAAWQFDIPAAGWTAWDNAQATQLYFTGSAWTHATADMTKAVYDTNNNGIVDKAENVDDGAGNATTAAQVKTAYTQSHVQGTDQALDTGGPNEITAAHAKEAYDKRGNYESSLKVILFNL